MRPNARSLLKKADLPALLITDLTNIRYVAGVTVSAGCILALPSGYQFFTDQRYLDEVKSVLLPGVKLRNIQDVAGSLQSLKQCGCEAHHVTLEQIERWKKSFPKTKFVPSSGAVEYFRRTKSVQEYASIKKACRITRSILKKIPSVLRIGITERALSWQIETWARELGAEGMAFPSIVAFGSHSSSPHSTPSQRKLKKGDIIQIDCGAKCNGYCSDFSEVFFTAQKTKEQAKMYRALINAKKAAIEQAQAGCTTHDIDRAARSTLKAAHVPDDFPYACGHGVGLDIHEGVVLSTKRPAEKILKNEVLAIEVGIHVPGTWGMRVEETIIVQ